MITLSIALLAALIIIGASYQFVREKIDDYLYPPPGELVDVGGYHLHIHRSGKGGPSVILDAGIGCNSLEWALVQKEIAKFTTVCSYDRAGYGWSDESPMERTSQNMVKELHTLLLRSEIPGPYVLVGHSLGGVNVRLYANTYPDEVVGVVLVDSAHEDQLAKLPMPNWNKGVLSSLTYLGALRLLAVPHYNQSEPPLYSNLLPVFPEEFYKTQGMLPDEIQKMYIAKWSTTKFTRTLLEEMEQLGVSFTQLRNTKGLLNEKPLIVITADKTQPKEVWAEFQKDLVTKSSNGKQIVAIESGHLITRHQPEIIVEAVREIVLGSR
ncbi:MAG: alpha/beta hydrolase [Chlamydiota bacterium]